MRLENSERGSSKNPDQIRRFFTPISKLVENVIFGVILALFANFEAERTLNGPKRKIFFSNVNKNKLYFPILVSD
jgi:hypothetical protein